MLGRNLIQAAAGNAAEVDKTWDVDYASFEGSDPGNDVFYVGGQEATPTGLFFKSDGSKMYICGYTGDDVNEYTLSTDWAVHTASYSQTKSVASEGSGTSNLFFRSDGEKMYIADFNGDEINEYDLSTGWDVSTASYNQNLDVSGKDNSPSDVFFKSDGLNMYFCGTQNDKVYQYSLTTAWDISTASYVRDFSVASQEAAPSGLFFKDDGTRMYINGLVSDKVQQYNLSTAWDISTATFDTSFNVASYDSIARALFFHPDGDKFFITGQANDKVWAFTIS